MPHDDQRGFRCDIHTAKYLGAVRKGGAVSLFLRETERCSVR